MTTRLALLSSLLLWPLLLGSAIPMPARADDCRDSRGEPIACASAPPPPEPRTAEHTHRDAEVGYINVAPFLDFADPSGVRFTPDAPSTVPDVERGSHLTGIGSGFDHAFTGLSFGFGYRPLPWLRLPELTLGFGYGDFEGMSVGIEGGGQSLMGSLHDCWLLRAQLAGGVDVDFDPVRLFALAHVGVGGYFAQVDVTGSSIGGLGSDTYSALSLELGWTVGMEVELDRDLAYTVSYRHIHTGVEQNSLIFGLNVRF